MRQCLHIREGKFVRPQSSWCRDARLLHLRMKGRMYGSTSTTSSVQTRRLLDDSLAVSHETSAIADNVMERLYGQRESLQTTQDRFGDMQNMTDNARLALRDMQRKAFLQKICLYSTIGILTILILLVAYREITNHGKLF